MAVYSLPDLDFDYGALAPHISGEIMELHHSKHHAAYVAGANTALDQLADARDKDAFGPVAGIERALAFHLGGHTNHSIFWTNLSPDGGDKPTGDLASAIGLAQLTGLDARTEQRRKNAAFLTAELSGDYLTPVEPEGREHVWHQYVMRFHGERARVIEGLTERGVGTLIYYPVPIHKQEYLQAYVPGAADLDLPVTNQLSDEVLAIPVHPKLSQEDLATIVTSIREVATPVAK